MKNLQDQGLVSEAEAEGRRTEARQKRQLAEAWSRSLERLQGDRQAELAEKRAELEALERRAAELETEVDSRMAVEKRLAHELSLHVIRSPVVGRTGDVVSLSVGEVVNAKEHLGTVIPSGELRVVAEFAPHRALGRVRKGQMAKLRLDGFSWIEYGSVACTVQRVAGEPQESTVRVELSIDEPLSFPVPLDHGLPGSLEIEVERITPAALVFRAAGRVASRPQQSQAHW
jgi:membrane fusion protein (multidrug efflux system)